MSDQTKELSSAAAVLLIGGMVLGIIGLIWYADHHSAKREATLQKELLRYGSMGVGQIVDVRGTGSGWTATHYKYRVRGQDYSAFIDVNIFPHCDGDRKCIGTKFIVIYSSRNPRLHKAFFHDPPEKFMVQ